MKTTRQKTSKNNDFPGDTTQKIDKIQNRAKNVKKRQKTREIEIQYIYIEKSHFSGYTNIGSRRWKIILGKSPPTPINFRVGIAWLPGRKPMKCNGKNNRFESTIKDL